jgi:hypothetical protein
LHSKPLFNFEFFPLFSKHDFKIHIDQRLQDYYGDPNRRAGGIEEQGGKMYEI